MWPKTLVNRARQKRIGSSLLLLLLAMSAVAVGGGDVPSPPAHITAAEAFSEYEEAIIPALFWAAAWLLMARVVTWRCGVLAWGHGRNVATVASLKLFQFFN